MGAGVALPAPTARRSHACPSCVARARHAPCAARAGGGAGARAGPDRHRDARPPPATWAGPVASGNNEAFDGGTGGPCSKQQATYCDITLVNADPQGFYATASGGVEFSTTGGPGAVDVDLYVYRSDASGAFVVQKGGARGVNKGRKGRIRKRAEGTEAIGALVGSSAGPTADENVAIPDASGWYRVIAVYWDMTNAGYEGRAEFFRRDKFPPDVDDPPGLQDSLASDPGLGYRSHSEPHIAQSPRNPNVLVAASKQYNRDPTSLADYEFKIGTYVSFDRGRTWTDLGPTGDLPARRGTAGVLAEQHLLPRGRPERRRGHQRELHHLGPVGRLRRRGQRVPHGPRLARLRGRRGLGHELPPLAHAVAWRRPSRPHLGRAHPDQQVRDRRGAGDDPRRQEHVRRQQRGPRRRRHRPDRRLLGQELPGHRDRRPAGHGVQPLQRRRPHVAWTGAGLPARAGARHRRARRARHARRGHLLHVLARVPVRAARRQRHEHDPDVQDHGRRSHVVGPGDRAALRAAAERLPAPGVPEPDAADRRRRAARRRVPDLRRLQRAAGRHARRGRPPRRRQADHVVRRR